LLGSSNSHGRILDLLAETFCSSWSCRERMTDF
jgi:hypothetical protein